MTKHKTICLDEIGFAGTTGNKITVNVWDMLNTYYKLYSSDGPYCRLNNPIWGYRIDGKYSETKTPDSYFVSI